MSNLEIEPNSLAELFARDPLQLADADISRIVEALRSQRAKWLVTETAEKKPKSAKATKAPPGPKVSLKLEDLL